MILEQDSGVNARKEITTDVLDQLSVAKCVVLSSYEEATRIALIKEMAKSGQFDSCLILRNPEEFYHFPHTKDLLLIIEDVFGINSYEHDHFTRWSHYFSDIKLFSQSGKLTTVMTTSAEVLNDFKTRQPKLTLPGLEVSLDRKESAVTVKIEHEALERKIFYLIFKCNYTFNQHYETCALYIVFSYLRLIAV